MHIFGVQFSFGGYTRRWKMRLTLGSADEVQSVMILWEKGQIYQKTKLLLNQRWLSSVELHYLCSALGLQHSSYIEPRTPGAQAYLCIYIRHPRQLNHFTLWLGLDIGSNPGISLSSPVRQVRTPPNLSFLRSYGCNAFWGQWLYIFVLDLNDPMALLHYISRSCPGWCIFRFSSYDPMTSLV